MSLPKVSVVIPVYGQSELVLRLVQSLKIQERLGEIIIVDDASPEKDETVLRSIEGVRYFRNKGNEGFDHSVNRGGKKAEHDYILVLNSDTEAYHEKCLAHLASDLDDGHAVAGALLLYPRNDPYRAERIQHAGVAIGYDSYPYHIFAGMHALTPAAQSPRIVTAVTGACLMTTRKWWERIGGFDEKFSPGVFEDVSYCLAVQKLGGTVFYDPRSVWTHAEHRSQLEGSSWFSREALNKNFTYLLMKHGNIACDDVLWYKGVS
jgi:GT2 family glycosyltransferase